jgi:hypothetical protein
MVEIAATLFIIIVAATALWVVGYCVACVFVGLGNAIQNIGDRGPIPPVNEKHRDIQTLIFLILFGIGVVMAGVSVFTHTPLQ